MGEKKRSNKKVNREELSPSRPRIEVQAGVIFVLGLFLAVSFLYYSGKPADREVIGLAGTYLATGMEKLFGRLALLFAGILILWSISIARYRTYMSQRMSGVFLLFFGLMVYFSFYQIPAGMTYFEAARVGLGGGYLGSALTYVLVKLLGHVGTLLAMVMMIVLGFVLVLDKSLYKLGQGVAASGRMILKTLEQIFFYEVEEEKPSEPVIVGRSASEDSRKETHSLAVSNATTSKDELSSIIKPKRRSGSGDYIRPPLDLLNPSDPDRGFSKSDIKESIKTLEDTFANFGIKIKVIQVSCGPAVTRYELQPAPGVKVSKILALADDLQLSLAAPGIRIEAPIPGKSAVGIEVPNEKIAKVGLRNILSSSLFTESQHCLTIALGEDISGNPVVANLADMPHLLIAGATGSGKSVCLNSIILSLLFKASPQELRLVLIDPKMVELTVFNGIPHLMTPVITDPKKAAVVLRWMNTEMEKRYKLFSEEGVRDIYRFNEVVQERMPFIVIVIDELADLMMVSPVEVEDAICRLAQMARAAGIHLVVATQRPSVDVVTGIIKANIPSRIAFAVSSQSDSRTILDTGGAEKLLGRGDMLFFPVGAPKPMRVQGAFVSDTELERVVDFLKEQAGQDVLAEAKEWEIKLQGDEGEVDDELFWEAVKIFVDTQKASVSLLQRKLRIGYSRAARLVDLMEERGIISPPDINKKREILIDEHQLDRLLNPELR